ncbi:MAG TPA: ATPase, partial [Microlunatus sp.]|nr:ATPase [Microlunatus sp.]
MSDGTPASGPLVESDQLRPHAEEAYADELLALERADDRPRPPRWHLSPWAVVDYLMGCTLPDGTVVTPKYI